MSESVIYTHDEKGKRQDVHAPSVINPGDYDYLRVGYSRKHPVTGGPAGTCHHCGKAIVWEVFYTHKPSGKVVTFGYICAGILDLTDNRIDHEMVLLKRTAENERRKEMAKMEWTDRRDKMVAEYPEVCEFLDNFDDSYSPNKSSFDFFLGNLKRNYERWGSLFPRQIDAIVKTMKKREEYVQRKLAEVAPTAPLDEKHGERQTLTGVIVSEKWVPGRHEHVKTHKMLVKLDNGNKVFGSMPIDVERAVDDSERETAVGMRVKFDAKVTRSNKDENFGFFNRPTKAQVV